MALIYLKSRKDPIEVSNEVAGKVKINWLSKLDPQKIIDLGRITFTYDQIKSIEMESSFKGKNISEDEIRKAIEGVKRHQGKVYKYQVPSDRVLKKLTSPREEYAVSQGVIKFDKFMNIVVCDSESYIKLIKILDVIQRREDAKLYATEQATEMQ